MAAEILTVPLKKTSELDLIKPMKKIIALRFSPPNITENVSAAITELNKLRSLACLTALDKNEASLEICARYILAIVKPWTWTIVLNYVLFFLSIAIVTS